jgi:hypothetical protein
MAKAVFHKGQRVFVKPVGTWAVVERVVPQWVKDVEEPLRVFYDVGLGRDFTASELLPEAQDDRRSDFMGEVWRISRQRNRWAGEQGDTSRHPNPGTHPVIVTDATGWGGWRVPAAEYDRDPDRVEFQARVIAQSMRMLRLVRDLAEIGQQAPENLGGPVLELAKEARLVLRSVNTNDQSGPAGTVTPAAAE